MAVTNKLNIESKTFYGSTLNFTTSVSNSEGDNGNGGGVSTGSKKMYERATNYPNCNNTGNPNCPPGSSCSTNSCRNGATNYPNCDNSVSKIVAQTEQLIIRLAVLFVYQEQLVLV